MKRIPFDRGHLREIRKKYKMQNNISEITNIRENINNVITFFKEIKIYAQL